MLGLVLEEGELTEMTVGDGNHIQVYLHILTINLAGKEFRARLGFSKGLGIGFYIMGRKDIFDQFVLCFHEKEKYVEISPLPQPHLFSFSL